MGLEREIESIKKRLKRIAPIKNAPKLKMNIFNEADYKNKKIPLSQSLWELNLVIEEKREYFTKQEEK